MPWQEALPMDLRMRFVADWQTGFWTVPELCGVYRVSRKTGYKWLDRHEREGAAGPADRSHRPGGVRLCAGLERRKARHD